MGDLLETTCALSHARGEKHHGRIVDLNSSSLTRDRGLVQSTPIEYRRAGSRQRSVRRRYFACAHDAGPDMCKPTRGCMIRSASLHDNRVDQFAEVGYVTLHHLHYILNVTWLSMAKSNSGRIVIEVDPGLKRRLYSVLAMENLTLKQWFIDLAQHYLSIKAPPVSPEKHSRSKRVRSASRAP